MPYLFLALGVAAVSSAPLLIRLAEPTSPLVLAWFRVGLAALVLGGLSGKKLATLGRLSPRTRWLLLASGASLAAHFALWIGGLSLTSTTAGVALVATQPIFAGLLGTLLYKEGFSRSEFIGMSVVLIGCLILGGGDVGGASTKALTGDAMALIAALMAALYLLVGRGLRSELPLLPYLAGVNATAFLVLTPLTLSQGLGLDDIGAQEFWAILGLALFPSIVGHTCLNHCVRHVPVHLVSLAILVEPIVGVASTFFVLGEVPTTMALGGGVIVIFGIFVGFGGVGKGS